MYLYCFIANADKEPIKIEEFTEHLAMLQANMCEQFQIDYNSLGSETEYTFHAAKLPVNVNKNRYKNILPCNSIYKYLKQFYLKCSFVDDHSRVVLKLEDKCPGSDYINASFIDVSKKS